MENEVKTLTHDIDLQSVLEQFSYNIYFKRKNEPMAHERVKFADFTKFFEGILYKKIKTKPDVDVFKETINHLANEIFEILPEANEEYLKRFIRLLVIIES